MSLPVGERATASRRVCHWLGCTIWKLIHFINSESRTTQRVITPSAIRRIAPEEVDRHVIRAHYGPGAMLGKKGPGYLEEKGVPRGSVTETYVAMRLEIGSWRWAGVPFLLRSGKRLP